MSIDHSSRIIGIEDLDIQPTLLNGTLTGNFRLLFDDGFVDLPGKGGAKTVIAARRAYMVIENGGTLQDAEDAAWGAGGNLCYTHYLPGKSIS